jgi:hypothetical protein
VTHHLLHLAKLEVDLVTPRAAKEPGPDRDFELFLFSTHTIIRDVLFPTERPTSTAEQSLDAPGISLW